MPYIPKIHEKYNVVAACRKDNVEVFIWNNMLLKSAFDYSFLFSQFVDEIRI